MKTRFLVLPLVVLMACNFARIGETVAESATPLPPTATITQAAVTATQPAATVVPSPPPFIPAAPQNVVLDFVARACEAQWSTNASYIPCPGDLAGEGGAYIEYSDHTVAEGMVSVAAPLLIGRLGDRYPEGLGLFGRYPPVQVFSGDVFRAVVGCQGDSPCDVQFALEYYDAAGNYYSTEWKWSHRAGEGLTEITADLTPLTGQTVEFILVARAQDDATDNWVVWIQPRIERDPNAPAPPTPAPTASATQAPEQSEQIPGVISGRVDMSSAPPFLNDPVLGSPPVVVVFFNLDDGTYWWIHTSLTGHPYYQMTVPPGRYQVVAYAQGVGDQPYVTAGYTGQNPSCGQALQVVEVGPNGRVENIVIADWNWLCGGDAYRPPKPADVPLP